MLQWECLKRQLVKLPIGHLKIIRSFIKNLRSGKESQVIVLTLVNMAKDLDIQVIAEGIETQKELDDLLSIECLKRQGFFLDTPLEVKAMDDVLIKKID